MNRYTPVLLAALAAMATPHALAKDDGQPGSLLEFLRGSSEKKAVAPAARDSDAPAPRQVNEKREPAASATGKKPATVDADETKPASGSDGVWQHSIIPARNPGYKGQIGLPDIPEATPRVTVPPASPRTQTSASPIAKPEVPQIAVPEVVLPKIAVPAAPRPTAPAVPSTSSAPEQARPVDGSVQPVTFDADVDVLQEIEDELGITPE